MHSRVQDLTGRTFGHLTVVAYAGSRKGPSRGVGHSATSPFWKVLCECGREDDVSGIKLKRAKRVSCNDTDCPYRDRRIATFRQAGKQVHRTYKKGAINRNLEWALSYDQFFDLITSPCHYSGAPPNKSIETAVGTFYWNGIDRIDSSKGYTPDNVVPCCTFANTAKMDRPYDEFVAWLDQVAAFRTEQKNNRTTLRGLAMAKVKGFKANQANIAKKEGVSSKAAGAILAASTRKASPAAKAKNPKLKKVK